MSAHARASTTAPATTSTAAAPASLDSRDHCKLQQRQALTPLVILVREALPWAGLPAGGELCREGLASDRLLCQFGTNVTTAKTCLVARCELMCPEGSHGVGCSENCKCQNGASCSHRDGSCSCTPGWTVSSTQQLPPPAVSSACPKKIWQHQLEENEKPWHWHEKHAVKTSEIYLRKFQGAVCANKCRVGKYGHGCRLSCECYNNATCDHVTGTCTCQPGFKGLRYRATVELLARTNSNRKDFTNKICDDTFESTGVVTVDFSS